MIGLNAETYGARKRRRGNVDTMMIRRQRRDARGLASLVAAAAVCLATLLCPERSMADICANVPCSGHGTCIVRNGEPECACGAGYAPDATGLNCVAAGTAAPAAASQPQPAVAPQPAATPQPAVAPQPAAPPTATAPPPAVPPAAGRPAPPAATPLPSAAPAAAGPLSTGWALSGAIVGFVGLAPITALGSASAATTDDTGLAIGLGAAATTLAAVISPITFVAGRSARRGGGVRGVMALRIVGWVLFGTCMVNAVTLIAFGAADIDIQPWQIAVTTATGDVAIVMFATEALVARSQVKRKMVQTPEIPPLVLSPTLAPVTGPTGVTGGILGVGGRF